MTDKKHDESIVKGSLSVDLSDLRRPVDDIFPGAHRQISMATGHCASPPFGCGKQVTGFRDSISEREYKITSLCQDCQDLQDLICSEMAEDEDDAEI